MIVGTLAAIHLLASCLATTPAGDRTLDNASEVCRFSFETEDEDPNYDLQPDNWTRRRGPGFPPYVRAMIDRSTASHGKNSLLVELNGAQFAYYSPLREVDGEHSYVLRGKIRSIGLKNDAALVSVSLLDATRRRVERRLSLAVTGRHEDWVTVEIGPFRPGPEVRFLVVGCHIAQGERTDVKGHVWFDDLWLGSVPLLELSQGSGLHFLQPNESVRIVAHARGLSQNRAHRLHLRLANNTGDLLEEAEFPLNRSSAGGANPETQGRIEWTLDPCPKGFYRVHAELVREGTTILAKQTSFVVMESVPMGATGEFGWSFSGGPGDLDLAALGEIASRSGVNWLKLPLWSTGYAEQKSDLSTSKMTLFLDQLDENKIALVGLLSDPPAQLADKYAQNWGGISKIFTMPRDFWYPSLEPIIARHSFRIRHWQLGSETDDSFVGLATLPQTLAAVKNEFDRIGHDAQVGVHWTWEHAFPNPGAIANTFFSLGGNPPLDGEKLREHLERTRAAGVARWVLVSPLPRTDKGGEISAPLRAADLARQMLAAKLGGATAIFAADPFDPQRGLLNPDGSPTEMFLPWRTVAMALRGAKFLGQFELPNRSSNAVFERGNEIVLVIWNSEETTEEYYLGEQATTVDLWGERRKLPIDSQLHSQSIPVGPTPLIIRSCSLPVARWRLAIQYAHGRISSEYGAHEEALLGTNTFAQGLTGKVTVRFPPGWEVEPFQWPLHTGAGEKFKFPMTLKFPPEASLGDLRTSVDFEVSADREYKFNVFLPYRLGIGDVDLKAICRRKDDGRLEIEQWITNNTEPLEILEFNCSLFIPGQVRQRHFVTRLGKGEDQRFYFVPNADGLRGKELRIRAEQVDGLRVLNYTWKVDE
jgi:hypothetical protein